MHITVCVESDTDEYGSGKQDGGSPSRAGDGSVRVLDHLLFFSVGPLQRDLLKAGIDNEWSGSATY